MPRKKGSWMGGPVPLVHQPEGRTLNVVPNEAETVRTLYDLYLQHRSILAVVRHANRLQLHGNRLWQRSENKKGQPAV